MRRRRRYAFVAVSAVRRSKSGRPGSGRGGVRREAGERARGRERPVQAAAGGADARPGCAERPPVAKMGTPAARRGAVAILVKHHEMSERRACAVIGAERTPIRCRNRRPDDHDLREPPRDRRPVGGRLQPGAPIFSPRPSDSCGFRRPTHRNGQSAPCNGNVPLRARCSLRASRQLPHAGSGFRRTKAAAQSTSGVPICRMPLLLCLHR